jgi:hypothetical protein
VYNAANHQLSLLFSCQEPSLAVAWSAGYGWIQACSPFMDLAIPCRNKLGMRNAHVGVSQHLMGDVHHFTKTVT